MINELLFYWTGYIIWWSLMVSAFLIIMVFVISKLLDFKGLAGGVYVYLMCEKDEYKQNLEFYNRGYKYTIKIDKKTTEDKNA